MAIKKCRYCGKEFDAKGTAAYCPGPHYAKCEVCGEDFEVDPREPKRTCSKECKSKLWKSAFKKKTVKCKLCGKEFHPKSSRVFFCDDPHYLPCEICGKPVLVKGNNPKYASMVCSEECRDERMRRRKREKYGYDNPHQRPESREKFSKMTVEAIEQRKAVNMELYGVEYTSQIPEVREKISKTIRSKEYQDNFKKRNLEKFGYEYAMHSPEFKAKQIQSRLKSKNNALDSDNE